MSRTTPIDPNSAAGVALLRAAERVARKAYGGRWTFAPAPSLTEALDAEVRKTTLLCNVIAEASA